MAKAMLYRQTHDNDPDEIGLFGIEDCMGQFRNGEFDAVVALLYPNISWIGLGARKIPCPGYADRVVFDHFLLLLPTRIVPASPKLIPLFPPHQGARHHVIEQNIEIQLILRLAVKAPPSLATGREPMRICRPPEDEDSAP
jgi:hypothetical protein